jgi:phosphoglycerol transferase MdoB-like AlkP superfamily enzyme
MSNVYDFTEYDKYLSLKVSTGLWLTILYLLRPYIVLIGAIGMGQRGTGSDGIDGVRNILYPDDFSLTLAILATMPALLFIYAWSRRKPGAGPLVKKLWRNGVVLLAVAASLNIVIVFVPLLTGAMDRVHLLSWVQIGFALAIIAYLYASRRVKDTFADFPGVRDN